MDEVEHSAAPPAKETEACAQWSDIEAYAPIRILEDHFALPIVIVVIGEYNFVSPRSAF